MEQEKQHIGIIFFSERGEKIAQSVEACLAPSSFVSLCFCAKGKLFSLTQKLWSSSQALIFIGSCGIGVRAIAPLVVSKLTDPAVLVIDEGAYHVISLLSGHYGGANMLTHLIAQKLQSDPVITTATDVFHLFAFDAFAYANNLALVNARHLTRIAHQMLLKKEGKSMKDITFFSPYPIAGSVPQYLQKVEKKTEADVCIDIQKDGTNQTLCLIPKILILGIGVRKGTSLHAIEEAFTLFMAQHCLFEEALACLVSIDLKKDEQGIIAFAHKKAVPFYTYTKELLATITTPSHSDFVEQTTGIGCVCEAAALSHATHGETGGELMIEKTIIHHITFALCKQKPILHW